MKLRHLLRPLALALCAAVFAPTAHAVTPKDDQWYTPDNVKWENITEEATVIRVDENGFIDKRVISINEEGEVKEISSEGADEDIFYPLLGSTALQAALANRRAKNNTMRIETIGKNLTDVLCVQGFDITDSQGNSYNLKLSDGDIGNGTQGGKSTLSITDSRSPDGKSLAYRKDGDSTFLEINGWKQQAAEENQTIFSDDHDSSAVLVRDSNGHLKYVPIGLNTTVAPLAITKEKRVGLELFQEGTVSALASLGTALTKNAFTDKEYTDYTVLARAKKEDGYNLEYVSVGSISPANANPDLATIVTNTLDGAAVDGALSLRGWSKAEDNALPYRSKPNNTLNWISPPPKDGKAYYLGTDSAAKFGYHELIASSNATKVAGDNATIDVTAIATDSTGTQVVSLKGWNNVYSSAANPLFLANAGGALAYLPIAFPEDNCTQKWDTVAKWVGSTAKNEAKSLTLPQESLAEYLKKEHGMVYATSENADLHFDTSSSGIEASFNAPNNWADDSTIKVNEKGKYALKVADSCKVNLSSLLQNPSSGTQHSFLALEASGALHYVPLGEGIKGGVQPDGVSIVSNETGLAIAGYANASTDSVLTRSTEGLEWKNLTTPEPITVDGVSIVSNETGLAIAGYANASADTVLTRSSSGVEWKSVTAEGDGTTITTTSSTTDPKLTIVGFENANTNTVLMKSAAGTLEWGAASGGGTIMGNTSDSVAVPISGAVFKSDEYSNVQIKTEIIDGVPTITIGVYYK